MRVEQACRYFFRRTRGIDRREAVRLGGGDLAKAILDRVVIIVAPSADPVAAIRVTCARRSAPSWRSRQGAIGKLLADADA